MTYFLKVFKTLTDNVFGTREVKQVYPIYKTRAQLISEGRFVPKRYINNTTEKKS